MKNIIENKDVRAGDKIRVTYKVGDIEISRAGVVHFVGVRYDNTRYFNTEGDFSLGPPVDSEGTIELLRRAQIELPTNPHAVIQYTRGPVRWVGTLQADGDWELTGHYQSGHSSVFPFEKTTTVLTRMVNEDSRTDFKVLFEGVSK